MAEVMTVGELRGRLADFSDTPAALGGRSRGQWFACTQHKDHRGDHSACDGLGRVLASWPRRKPEKYWHPEDCAGCAHHRKARSWLN